MRGLILLMKVSIKGRVVQRNINPQKSYKKFNYNSFNENSTT